MSSLEKYIILKCVNRAIDLNSANDRWAFEFQEEKQSKTERVDKDSEKNTTGNHSSSTDCFMVPFRASVCKTKKEILCQINVRQG